MLQVISEHAWADDTSADVACRLSREAGHPHFAFFEHHARGPAPLLEVDDAQQAAAELKAAGAEVIGNPDVDDAWTWVHVRGP